MLSASISRASGVRDWRVLPVQAKFGFHDLQVESLDGVKLSAEMEEKQRENGCRHLS
jgi:hypothetical protein